MHPYWEQMITCPPPQATYGPKNNHVPVLPAVVDVIRDVQRHMAHLPGCYRAMLQKTTWCNAEEEIDTYNIYLLAIQWVPLNIIPSVHETIMTISRIFYYPMYSYYRGYRGTIGRV